MKYFVAVFTCLVTLTFQSLGQETQVDSTQVGVLQISGILVAGDSLVPVPFATVSINDGTKGTITDNYGFFTLAARTGDSLNFTSIGFKKAVYYIPDSLDQKRYSIVEVLQQDTISLPTTTIYPFPTRERFKEEFLALQLQDDAIERARKNLDPDEMYNDMLDLGMSPNATYQFLVQQQIQQQMNANQAVMNPLLNPLAWAQFIESWKRGDFKRQ